MAFKIELVNLEDPFPHLIAISKRITSTVSNTARLSPKKHSEVGWVEERNPTFSGLCWVSLRSTQPTNLLNRAVLVPLVVLMNYSDLLLAEV